MTETVIQRIIALLLGHRYYANIINIKGTEQCEISCHIFNTRAQAVAHRHEVETTYSYLFVETVAFRSRREYGQVKDKKPVQG